MLSEPAATDNCYTINDALENRMRDAEYFMKQAAMTAHDYMLHAKEDIDKIFGEGFAAKNPSLVAAYMQTAALDFATMFGLQNVSESLDGIAERLGE